MKRASFTEIFIIFQDNSPEYWCTCNLFTQAYTFHHGRNEALHSQPFTKKPLPLPQYCGLNDLQNVSSVANTTESLAEKSQDNRTDTPNDPTKLTTVNLLSNIRRVGLQCHNEAPHLTTDVQICSCEQSHAVIALCHKARNSMCMTSRVQMPECSQHTNVLGSFFFSEKLSISTAFHLDLLEWTGAHVSLCINNAFINLFLSSLNDRDVKKQQQNADW